ncbi:MAG: transcriptional regulator KorA [Oscillospiraceae bacterium]|nr:transcriptional regulator KorA [Oscillospiraceae bacterium]
MTVSDAVKGLLGMSGKKQVDLAARLGMTKQSMSNKIKKNSWFASDLVKAADLCGCKVAFILPDGQQIIVQDDGAEKKEAPGE